MQSLVADGFCFLRGARPAIERNAPLEDWDAFAASWGDLGIDRYLAETGRTRRRRHGVYSVSTTGQITREPHQPHYQEVDYNALQGGIERWFEPITDSVAEGPSLRGLLAFAYRCFSPLATSRSGWRAEVHQMRIEAREGAPGQPTPEGVHRDGVDYVLVLLVARHNIVSGTTTIHAQDGRLLGDFTLTEPFDAALLDDARVWHGVTAVEPLDAGAPAYRDVLILTLKALGPRVEAGSA